MKKFVSLVLTAVLLATMLSVFAVPAFAEEPKKYIVRRWDGNKVVETPTNIPTNAVNITDSTNTLDAGKWYVVSGNVTVSRITVNGTENSPTSIILKDGCKLTVQQGIFVEGNRTLHIYGQELDSGMIFATGSNGCAGIGGASLKNSDDGKTFGNCGNITVYGGTVNATGGEHGAGIGGGIGNLAAVLKGINLNYGKGGNVTVYGGTVNATGGDRGAGIGAGEFGNGGNITVYDGTVNTTGSNGGAGIGGGSCIEAVNDFIEGFVKDIPNSSFTLPCGNGGNVNVYGGTVNATGSNGGAGIGGGSAIDNLKAYSAGIGGGNTVTGNPKAGRNGEATTIVNVIDSTVFCNGGNIKVYGGEVNATGVKGGAGIGGGAHNPSIRYSGDGGDVEIMKGTVNATGGGNAQGIGHGDGAEKSGSLKLNDYAIIKAGDGRNAPSVVQTYNGAIFVNIHYHTAETLTDIDGTQHKCSVCGAVENHRYENSVCACGKEEPAPTASIFSEGNIWIIAIIAVVVLGGVAALFIVKKKKKPALAGDAENTDEE